MALRDGHIEKVTFEQKAVEMSGRRYSIRMEVGGKALRRRPVWQKRGGGGEGVQERARGAGAILGVTLWAF